MIEFRVLGTLAIQPLGGAAPAVAITQPKRLALLLYLTLAEPAGTHSRESLMALLWPDADTESARHSLRNTLYGLRQALGEAAIDSRGEGYVGLNPDAIRCDAVEVRRFLKAEQWEDALSAWRGDLAPGFHLTGAPEFEQWLDAERAGLRRAITSAAWHRVDQLEKAGDVGLVPAARRAWILDPADESGARRLLRLLDAKVGTAAALRAYHDLEDHLRREFEAEPSAETRALAAELEGRMGTQTASPTRAHKADRADEADEADKADKADAADRADRADQSGGRRIMVAALLLIVGGISLFALRPASSRLDRATLVDSANPVAMAESAGAFPLPSRYRQDTAAFGSYLRGLTLRQHRDPIASRDTFAWLVDRKPLYAPGYSGLAHAYLVLVVTGFVPPEEGYPKAEVAAQRAIALDSTLGSAYVALSNVEMIWRWNVPRAGALLDRAIALNPQDPEAHILRGNWFRWQGQADSALAEAQRTYQLDPLNPGNVKLVARMLVFSRRYAEAEAMFRQRLKEYPMDDDTYGELAEFYQATGRMRDWLETLRSDAEAVGDTAWLARLPPATSDSQAALVFAKQSREELRDLLDRKQSGKGVHGADFVFAYAHLRDTSETLRWLDSMVIEHDPISQNILVNPQFDFLRGDPRYKAWEKALPWRVRR